MLWDIASKGSDELNENVGWTKELISEHQLCKLHQISSWTLTLFLSKQVYNTVLCRSV